MLEITIEYKGAKYWHNPTTRLCYLEIDCEECQFVRLGKRCGGWVKVEDTEGDDTAKVLRKINEELVDYLVGQLRNMEIRLIKAGLSFGTRDYVKEYFDMINEVYEGGSDGKD
jgi:hypothetical protein